MFTPTATPIDVIVVGGGITGLTVAYTARKRGLDAVVFEASTRAGGLIDTEQIDGFTIEGGPDSLLAQKTAGVELCEELNIASDLQAVRPPGGAFVLKGRRLFRLPSPSVLGLPVGWRALLRFDLLPPLARARLGLEPWIRARHDGEDESVASFFRRRFGRATVDLVAQPLLGGIHAGDIERRWMKALFPRLLDLERTHGHVLTLRARTGRQRAAFVAPRGGMQTIVARLAAELGGALVSGAAVTRIERTGGLWHVWRSGNASPSISHAVVLAIPAFAAADLLATVDADAARECRAIPYASTAGVALAWPRGEVAHSLSGTGFVVARRQSDVRITACTWVSSKWEHRAPAGAVLLRAFAGGVHDPAAVDLDDRTLVGIVRRDLEATLGITAAPSLWRVYRWRRASVQHNVGQLARVAAIDARLAAHPGLLVAGAGFRAVGIPDCIADARAAVDRILLTRSES
jgi:oxygen-dependent protoporphyrinogen oxidase